ncbi:MAG: TetR/AcrR family transcriptional regulator [Streptosporangiaceae bacterium]
MAVKRLRERQAEATRQQLIDVARQLFTERGYAGTSIEDIIERAGVARGALYHHFPGKGALFAAVYQEVQAEVASAVVAAALTADDPAQAVHIGLSAFLDACLEPQFRQIVVLDSVPVLQRQAWEDDSTEHSEHSELDMLSLVLTPLAAAYLPGLDIEALAHVALGGLYGAALYIARSPEPVTARAAADVVLDTLITGLRSGAGAATSRPAQHKEPDSPHP